MSELQNDEAIIEDDNVEIENHDTDGAELAADSEQEHEEQPVVDEEAKKQAEKQAAIQKVINEKTFKAKQAEREAQEYKAKLDAYEAKEREKNAQQYASIPEMPDPFDEEYDAKVRARDEAIANKTRFDTQNGYYAQQKEYSQQQAAREKEEKLWALKTTYTQKAASLGVKPEELQAAGNAVGQYGLSEDLQMYILNDPHGPLITKYLAGSPQEGFELASMSPYAVGKFLDEIKVKAGALKPKTSNAPKPATSLHGNGVNPDMGKYKNLKGVKYE